MNNPTQPEVQPSLEEDRDPIPSPDVEVQPKETANSSSSAPAASGQIREKKQGVYTMNVDVDEVLMSCAVVDEKGHPVMNLGRQNFRIWEDGVPQTLTSFQHQDLPVSMGILIDNSGSMRDKRGAVNDAAMRLLQDSNRQDSAFVVNFNDHAYLDQGFTTDLVALNRGINHFDSHGTTAMYDAVAASADELAHHAKETRQVLLIITDGADNASHLSLQDAVRRVQGLAGPVVYTIGLLYDDDPKEYQKAHDDLETLSADTGGLAYFPRSIDEVGRIASEVARDIRNQYLVGYHSTKPSSLGGFRRVHVEAQARGYKQLTVRTKSGYYAQPGQRNHMAGGPRVPQGQAQNQQPQR
ncbi:MAG: VWA domain-containing protein [Acidobacteriota bacterium]